MSLRVVGAGLPRTATHSQRLALEHLLGGPCHQMSVIPGHPFNLGADWDGALAGEPTDWTHVLDGFVAAVDWPASMFWRELHHAHPDSLVILSVRDSAETWWHSMNGTILPVARTALAPTWSDGRGLLTLLDRFAETLHWDDQATLIAAYERHNARVRESVQPDRLLEWRAEEGWEPICRALGVSVPEIPFPWVNRRADWG